MSKNAQTFRKSELSKNRIKKKEEKSRKKEERKGNNNKGKSFEDQLVYVDYLGRLTNIPPSKQKKASDVVDNGGESDFVEGRVKFVNPEKGFGFIKINDSNEEVFFKMDDEVKDAKIGEMIIFKYRKGTKGFVLTRLFTI